MNRFALLGAVVVLAGCGASSPRVPTSQPAIDLLSPAFTFGQPIPKRYACPLNTSPPLRWSGVPSGTRELALEMIDVDAPGGAFVHWALAGISPRTTRIAAGDPIPAGAVAARNDFGHVGYGGPCPPPGKPHRYVVTLLALRARSGLRPGFSLDALQSLRALASGTLTGTYRR